MAMAEDYYTPKLQKRTLKGHSGPVLCLAHSSERLVIRNHPRRHRRGHSVVDAKSTATSSASAVDDRRPQPASSLEGNLHTQDHSNYHASLLLSGSSDGTIRLWDLRTRKTSICVHVPKNAETVFGGGNEVTSVAFHPLLEDDEDINNYDDEDENNINSNEGEVSEVCAPDVHCGSSSSSGEYTIYASTPNFVYGYDLRHYHLHNQQQKCSNNIDIKTPSTSTTSTMRIIQGPPHFDLTPLFQCTDEINQLSFTFRRNANSHTAAAISGGGGRDRKYDIFLSAADDSGEVHIVENPPNRRCYDTTIATSTLGNNSIHREHNGDDINKPTILCHAEPHTLGIASCASFQPRASYSSSSSSSSATPSSALLLATGGTDCTVKLWDISHCNNTQSSTSSSSQRHKHRKQQQQQFKPRPPRLTSTMTISPYETAGGGGDDGDKLWNPPYIHSLSWSASGQFLAAGIGDGSVSIYRVEGRTLAGIGRLGRNEDSCNDDEEARAGHGSAVASVRFANFGSGRNRGVGGVNDADDRLLLSSGNDGTIICWDLGGNMVGRGPLDPKQYLRSPASGGDGGGCQHSSQSMDKSRNDPLGDNNDDFTPSPPRVLFKVAHRHKPNWMTCSPFFDNDNTSSSCNYSSPSLPGTIFVADVTKDISAYTLAEI